MSVEWTAPENQGKASPELSQEGGGLVSSLDADRRGVRGAQEAALGGSLGGQSTCCRLLGRGARARGHRRANFRFEM